MITTNWFPQRRNARRVGAGALLLGSLAVAVPSAGWAQSLPVEEEPRPRRLDTSAAVELPFDLVGGLVVLRGMTLNGRRGDFVLDTGNAFALVVDRASFAGQLRPAKNHPGGLGATGRVAVQELPVTQFQFGAARYVGFAAVAVPLAHVRRYVGGNLLGLLGYGLLRDYEVVIDYPGRRVYFYALGTPRPAPRPFARQDSLAFDLVRGFPIATGAIGQVPVRLLLDTGAATSQLDAAFCQQLPAGTRPTVLGTEPLTGSDGHPQLVSHGYLPSLVLEATTWQHLPVGFSLQRGGKLR